MRTVGILQPGYLPWLGFFAQLQRADLFVILDDVQYDKHGWRNRNRIKGPGGPMWLTVPVLTKGQRQPLINEVAIDPSQPRWPAKHLGALRQCYGKAPFFDQVFPAVEEELQKEWRLLLDLDLALIRRLASLLGLEREMALSSRLGPKVEDPNLRLIEICRRVGADVFYEGASGRDYLDLDLFKQNGIEVVFQDYRPAPHPQQFEGFLPYLSALDLLFNVGPESSRYLPGLLSEE